MTFYFIEPEVAGELGDRTLMDRSVHPPKVERLHYHFSGWLGDCLLESFPSFIVTDAAQAAIQARQLSGVQFGPVEVTTSEEFKELFPGKGLPKFMWLKPTGEAGVTDFGIARDHRLVISDPALSILKSLGLNHAIVEKHST